MKTTINKIIKLIFISILLCSCSIEYNDNDTNNNGLTVEQIHEFDRITTVFPNAK